MFKHINELQLSNLQMAKKDAAVISNGQVLFTISGGPILATTLIGRCRTANDATASTVTFSADPTESAATAITGTSASLASAAIGATVICSLATAATAPSVLANGVGVFGHTTRVLIPEGTITVAVGVGDTTGTWEWYLQYEPLTPNSVVS